MTWDSQLRGLNPSFFDVDRRALGTFCSVAWRKVFVELPAQACPDKSNVGRLLRSMYGCRDAGVNWARFAKS